MKKFVAILLTMAVLLTLTATPIGDFMTGTETTRVEANNFTSCTSIWGHSWSDWGRCTRSGCNRESIHAHNLTSRMQFLPLTEPARYTVRNDVPLRLRPYEPHHIFRRLGPTGTRVQVTRRFRNTRETSANNWRGNYWYRTNIRHTNGEYFWIYSGNLSRTNPVRPDRVTVTVTHTNGGTARNSFSLDRGQWGVVWATPHHGFRFDGWFENGHLVSSTNNWHFQVNSNRSIQARFSPINNNHNNNVNNHNNVTPPSQSPIQNRNITVTIPANFGVVNLYRNAHDTSRFTFFSSRPNPIVMNGTGIVTLPNGTRRARVWVNHQGQSIQVYVQIRGSITYHNR